MGPTPAVPHANMVAALKRSPLGFFTVVSCHHQGVPQTLITRGGEAPSVGHGTHVVLTEGTAHCQAHQFTLVGLESNMEGWPHLPIRMLTCLGCSLSQLQGCHGPTTGAFGQGKHAHHAWGVAVATPCAQTVCGTALHAAGCAPTLPQPHVATPKVAVAWTCRGARKTPHSATKCCVWSCENACCPNWHQPMWRIAPFGSPPLMQFLDHWFPAICLQFSTRVCC